ncbi:Uncharacterized protein conserved in bacteria [Salmonella enterica subsp. arizonae]|uniref:Uncharacterized protein conserved in bacteria n=1 Tax=Salmonella enterica subsp. arizonae TaxID=59203 RepID=A0A2X4TCJ3_SALER|nr:Uncharacterized protein conserved in bacteria [Salmonella enterica subsp. arizonae]
MDTLTAISRWLAKQHVVTWCVCREGELWCANAFYLFDAQHVAFYLLTDDKTRHAQMSGAHAPVAGTVNGQPKTVAHIRGVQFKGEIRRLEGQESDVARKAYLRRFPVARVLPRRYGKSGWMKLNSPTTRWDLVKKCAGYATQAPSRRSASRLNAGRSSGVRLVTS